MKSFKNLSLFAFSALIAAFVVGTAEGLIAGTPASLLSGIGLAFAALPILMIFSAVTLSVWHLPALVALRENHLLRPFCLVVALTVSTSALTILLSTPFFEVHLIDPQLLTPVQALVAAATPVGMLILAMLTWPLLRKIESGGTLRRIITDVLLAATTICALYAGFGNIWSALAKNVTMGPVLLGIFLLFGLLLGLFLAHKLVARFTARSTIALATLWFALTVAGILTTEFNPAARQALQAQSGGTNLLITLGQFLSDHDGDGYGRIFGESDCNDQNPFIHPFALDRPGNGIDEDCFEGDAKFSELRKIVQQSGESSDPKNLNFLIILIDAMRADHTSLCGGKNKNTKNIEKLAQNGMTFCRAYTPAGATNHAIPAIFTGCNYSDLDMDVLGRVPKLSDQIPTLFTQLHDAGWRTEAHLPAQMTQSMWHGFERGFDLYQGYPNARIRQLSEPAITPMVRSRLRQLAREQRENGAPPFAMFVHYLEPHEPYLPNAEFNFGRHPQDLYDSEIASADVGVGSLMQALQTENLNQNTVVVVFGDHGEAFNEHGRRYHNKQLFDESIRVPLVIHVPNQKAKRVDSPVALKNLSATLLKLANVPQLNTCDDESLTAKTQKPIIVESIQDALNPRKRHVAMIDWPYKAILNITDSVESLYNLEDDPMERRELRFLEQSRFEPMATTLRRKHATQLTRDFERLYQKHVTRDVGPSAHERNVEIAPGLFWRGSTIEKQPVDNQEIWMLRTKLAATKTPNSNIQLRMEGYEIIDGQVSAEPSKPKSITTPLAGFYPTSTWAPGDLVEELTTLRFHGGKKTLQIRLSFEENGQVLYGPEKIGTINYNPQKN